MNYEIAEVEMKKGNKVKQGSCIYFLGKNTVNEPYTLKLRTGTTPIVTSGFKKINKNGLFTNAS